MAANYSVNINLDTKKARDAIDVLEKRVNRLRRSLNKPIAIESKAVMLQKQQLQLQDRKFATMKITRRLGEQVRKHEEQGLKLDRLRLELKNAARHTDKGRLETARSANKFVADELRNLEKQAQAKVKNAGIDKQKLRDLNLMIGKKRVELSLIRTAGKFADFNARQRKGIGPNNLLGLPSTEMLKPEQRGIMIRDPNTLGRLNTSQVTKDRTTALGFEKRIEDIKRRSLDKTLGLRSNQKLLNHLSEAGLNIQRKNFNLVKQELGQAELLIAAAKKQAAVQKDFDKIDKDKEKFLKGAPVKFKAFDDRYGPQMAPPGLTKGAGQVAMSIDTITKQSQKRLGIEMKLRELEAKGVKTTKIRAKMGELVDAQNKKQFGTIKKLNREIGRAITKEEGKLKILRLQNKERMEANRMTVKESAAQGPFSRLSDRQSRDAQGKRTFMNNPFVGGIARSLPQGMQPTRGFDFGSAMISGGFPLLFGQGPVTAAAGALGGGIGGMFGQMGGFAGGIAATAVVQSINQALTAMSELGKAMGPFTQNSQALTDSLGLQGSAEEARIKLIEQSEGKTAAFNASMQLMTTRIGEDGVKNLEKFGETTRLLGSEMSLAITQLHALGAGIANFVLNITGLKEGLEASAATRSVADAAARGDTAAQGLVDRRQQIEAMGSRGGEARRKQNLLDILEAEEKIFAIRQNTVIEADLMTQKFDSMVRSLEAEKEEAERLVELREQGLNPAIAKTIAALEKEASLAKDLLDAEIELLLAKQARIGELGEADQTRLTTLEAQKDKIDESVEGTTKLVKETNNLNDAANETVDAFTQLRDTIAQDIGNGLKDLITGAKSLNEVLSNILANMANSFLNLGIFGNIGGTFKPGEGLLGSIFRADGGPVKAGGKYVVGERGPELFSPTRSGMITPNHALGGSTNVNVNVDASGSSVEGDANQAEQLGSAISEAIQAELIQQRRPGGILYN